MEKTGGYTFRIILTQGLNRQIRRMCDALGYRVVSLKRVRIMNIRLGDLRTGSYREVTGEEWAELERLLADSSNNPGGSREKTAAADEPVKRERKKTFSRKEQKLPGGEKEKAPSGEKRIFRTPLRHYEAPEEGQERRNVFHRDRKKD